MLFPLLHDMFSTRLGGVKETHGCVIAACEELSRKSTNDDVVNGFGVDWVVVVGGGVGGGGGGGGGGGRGAATVPCSTAGSSRLVGTRVASAASVVFHRSKGGAHGVVGLFGGGAEAHEGPILVAINIVFRYLPECP